MIYMKTKDSEKGGENRLSDPTITQRCLLWTTVTTTAPT